MITAAEIKAIKALKDRSHRIAEGLFVAQGDKLIGELLGSRLVVKRLFVTSDSRLISCQWAELISSSQMERISSLRSAPESLALVELPQGVSTQREEGLTLVLDGVQDPGNIGTIIRLAHWYGIKQIFCSRESADCYSTKVVQSTMGAIAAVDVIYTDLEEFLDQQQVPIYGTFLQESASLYDQKLDRHNAIIVMGNEGQGISPSIERRVSKRLFIPPYPAHEATVESLNVAVATAVIVAEFRRGRSL
ncbi:MAG: RNA methyltransferase [Rikenellaceae bacterium]